jgi:hypothetical protein
VGAIAGAQYYLVIAFAIVYAGADFHANLLMSSGGPWLVRRTFCHSG